jgi:hypothetical protein
MAQSTILESKGIEMTSAYFILYTENKTFWEELIAYFP